MMNLSGFAIGAASHFYKVSPQDTWVIFDDLDVPFGKLRVRSNGTSGGHQGVASTINAIGTGFMRARMGISMNNRAVEPSEVYVLAPFNAQEKDRLTPVIEAASAKLQDLVPADLVEDSTFDLA
jgi:PTH1 family peptidyl-tRNA hydrolase